MHEGTVAREGQDLRRAAPICHRTKRRPGTGPKDLQLPVRVLTIAQPSRSPMRSSRDAKTEKLNLSNHGKPRDPVPLWRTTATSYVSQQEPLPGIFVPEKSRRTPRITARTAPGMAPSDRLHTSRTPSPTSPPIFRRGHPFSDFKQSNMQVLILFSKSGGPFPLERGLRSGPRPGPRRPRDKALNSC